MRRFSLYAAGFLIFSASLWAELPLQSTAIQPPVPADEPLFRDTGDAAIARRYLEWAEREYNAGRTAEALAALERGADYNSASSDISYYLALLRSHTKQSRLLILETCRLALETDRWERFTPEDARLLEAETLTGLRRFEEALNVLKNCGETAYAVQFQRLLALRGIAQLYGDEAELIRTLALTMDRFPRETAPVRLLFEYAARGGPNPGLRSLIDLALRRLPVLTGGDPGLAYLAAPFIYNKEEALSHVAAYRALGNPNPAALPAAIHCGLINGNQAVEELFAWRQNREAILDRDLITAVSRLLRGEDERAYLRRNLLQFSGVITEDRDHDHIIEARTTYKNGLIVDYSYDADQDGEADVIITFAQGIPAHAKITLAPDGAESFSRLMPKKWVLLYWERYPAVLNAELEGKRYIPRPLDYFYTPLRFAPLVLGGPDYPEREALLPVLTERSLLSYAIVLEQPSADFPGGTERIELSGGIPLKSTVYVNGKIVSETSFRSGRPLIQYLDIDIDGRMESIRRYDPDIPYKVLSTESDWDGDGSYEYRE